MRLNTFIAVTSWLRRHRKLQGGNKKKPFGGYNDIAEELRCCHTKAHALDTFYNPASLTSLNQHLITFRSQLPMYPLSSVMKRCLGHTSWTSKWRFRWLKNDFSEPKKRDSKMAPKMKISVILAVVTHDKCQRPPLHPRPWRKWITLTSTHATTFLFRRQSRSALRLSTTRFQRTSRMTSTSGIRQKTREGLEPSWVAAKHSQYLRTLFTTEVCLVATEIKVKLISQKYFVAFAFLMDINWDRWSVAFTFT